MFWHNSNSAVLGYSHVEAKYFRNRNYKCPYGLVHNEDSNECQSVLGDPCDVSKHSCGQNTECSDSKCTCTRGYFRAYNNIDCLTSDVIWKDKRFRFEPMRSWRLKDSPENRLIECPTNANFSSKCQQVLNQSNTQLGAKLSSLFMCLNLLAHEYIYRLCQR
ncbi:unnamed protein product [Allacma fusca]|uniref:EB domain-containing protein n=1 Tax=Allacma fusca TaxID=39272 RepID=A0A8J2PRZ2_9HEXA|nr:unnamed protein product [Allacma fusca]